MGICSNFWAIEEKKRPYVWKKFAPVAVTEAMRAIQVGPDVGENSGSDSRDGEDRADYSWGIYKAESAGLVVEVTRRNQKKFRLHIW